MKSHKSNWFVDFHLSNLKILMGESIGPTVQFKIEQILISQGDLFVRASLDKISQLNWLIICTCLVFEWVNQFGEELIFNSDI